MRTILRIGAYRFFFFSNEDDEPPHIHVKSGNREAKFWLKPLILAANYGFKAYELNTIQSIIREYHTTLLEIWNEHFN